MSSTLHNHRDHLLRCKHVVIALFFNLILPKPDWSKIALGLANIL